MKLQTRVRQEEENKSDGKEKREKLDNNVTTDCELIERDPLTGRVLRIERHEILLKRNQKACMNAECAYALLIRNAG